MPNKICNPTAAHAETLEKMLYYVALLNRLGLTMMDCARGEGGFTDFADDADEIGVLSTRVQSYVLDFVARFNFQMIVRSGVIEFAAPKKSAGRKRKTTG